MSERFGLLKKGYGKLKQAVEPETEDQKRITRGLEQMQGLNNLKQRALGVEIPQTEMPNEARQTKPYKSEYINRPGSNLDSMARSDEHMARMNDAVKQRQMQELEDLEMMGAFDEDPNSEVQQKIKRLKSVLGQ